jgi:hypothetical protein
MEKSFECVSCHREFPSILLFEGTECCQGCWYKHRPIVPSFDSATAFLLFNQDIEMIYLPRIKISQLNKYHDAWTQPDQTPVPMQAGPCHAPRHAIWPTLMVPRLMPLDTAMDIEVTPIMFNAPHPRDSLFRESLATPILLQDDGTLKIFDEQEKCLATVMKSVHMKK